jgi:hypothetical protein
MSLWILITFVTVWLGACAAAVSLCAMAGRSDRRVARALRGHRLRLAQRPGWPLGPTA